MIGVGDASRELAGLFAGGLKDESIKLLRGVVESVVGGRVFLYLSGDNTYAVGPFVVLDTGYGPTPGDVVWVLKNGPDYLVIGRHASGGPSDISRLVSLIDALPKGMVARATSSQQYTAVTNATIVVTTAGVSYSYQAGRNYMARYTAFAVSQSDTSSRFNIGFENVASVTYGEQWIGRFLQQAQSYTWENHFTASGFMGMRIRASRRDGSGNATFFTGPRNGWSGELVVIDEGAAG